MNNQEDTDPLSYPLSCNWIPQVFGRMFPPSPSQDEKPSSSKRRAVRAPRIKKTTLLLPAGPFVHSRACAQCSFFFGESRRELLDRAQRCTQTFLQVICVGTPPSLLTVLLPPFFTALDTFFSHAWSTLCQRLAGSLPHATGQSRCSP